MKNSPNEACLTRRAALLNAVKSAVAAAVVAPVIAQAATQVSAVPAEPEFVPENDYPFFGGALPEAYAMTLPA